MLRIPVSSLPLKKQRLLANSPLTPPAFISIEGHHYDKFVNAVIYEIQVGVQNGHDVVTNNLKARFSDLEKLDQTIKTNINKKNNSTNNSSSNSSEFQSRNSYPFPPKRWFGNTSESFVCEREEALRKYIDWSLKNPDILYSKEFLHFFQLEK